MLSVDASTGVSKTSNFSRAVFQNYASMVFTFWHYLTPNLTHPILQQLYISMSCSPLFPPVYTSFILEFYDP